MVGLLTPLAAAMSTGQVVTAAVAAHLPKGLWNTNGGFEPPLAYTTVAAALAFPGPGTYSLDGATDLSLSGVWYGIGAIVLGAVAAVIVLTLRRSVAARQRAEPGTRLAA